MRDLTFLEITQINGAGIFYDYADRFGGFTGHTITNALTSMIPFLGGFVGSLVNPIGKGIGRIIGGSFGGSAESIYQSISESEGLPDLGLLIQSAWNGALDGAKKSARSAFA